MDLSTATTKERKSPSLQSSTSNSRNCLREAMLRKNLPVEVTELLTSSWSEGTQNSHNVYLKNWKEFCEKNDISPFETTYQEGMKFLAELYNKENAKYGYIAAARSALSAVLPKDKGTTFGTCEEVSRMLKGIFKLRPTLPRYTVVYDPELVLEYITRLPENKFLDMEFLIKKLATLLCLLSAQRAQTIGALRLDFCHRSDNAITFYIPSVLKTTKPGKHQEPLIFRYFPDNEKICVVSYLKEYLSRTENIRENLEMDAQQLILSYAYPIG